MPIAITINCHSDRTSSCIIKNGEINYEHQTPYFINFEDSEDVKEVFANDVEIIKSLKQGEEVLLTGEIYVARDMAHKRMIETDTLPIDIKDKIIFYAGPCPNKPNEAIGSVGPTTASRMDKYAVELYNKGLLATIGKGSRSEDVKNAIKQNNAKYFTVVGGVAALLSDKVKSSEIIAYEDLGAEALYKLYVEKFPVKVELS
ncbi:MAG: fumarate hydratase C-terminal domain-containing protein [Candidatus Gastranaerophilales bacterium]|nr:fumarate hydratase C-terminal domain-containing protein [Candidatus Gastranaerophilales bacterium]